MYTSVASPCLATISYRIATEPGFIHKLKSMLSTGKLDADLVISADEAAALTAYLDQASPALVTDSDTLDTWWI